MTFQPENPRNHFDGYAAFARYESGLTLSEVAKEFGVSQERVRQVFSSNGFKTRSVAEAYALKRARMIQLEGDRIRSAFSRARDVDVVVDELRLPRSIVEEVVENAFPGESKRRKLKPTRKRYSDDELREFLLTANKSLGGILSAGAYTKFAKTRKTEDGRPWPTHQTFGLRYGSWRAALLDAGLTANPSSAIAGQTIFDDAHCIDALRTAARRLGLPLRAYAYEEYARDSNGALPSLATVRHKLGRWNEALDRAGLL